MKRIKTTGAWLLFCYILAVTNASPGHRTHVPEHGHPRSILSPVAPTIRIPDQLMSHSQEVSCVSADINIFEIFNEAKQTCKGNELHVKFYYYSNQKYYFIGACDVNKELFDTTLMKYDHWLITGEGFNKKDIVVQLPDHLLEVLHSEGKNATEIANSEDNIDGLVVSDDHDGIKLGVDDVDQNPDSNTRSSSNEFDIQASENIKGAPIQENGDISIDTGVNKDKYDNYVKLKPKYDGKNKYFEVFLPEDEHEGKERTINVEIAESNDYPYVKDDNKVDKVSDKTYTTDQYKETEGDIDTTQSNEDGDINIQKEGGKTNVDAESASEANVNKPQTYTTVDSDNDNKQYVSDSQPNYDNSESINSNNHDMPNINTEFSNNINDASSIDESDESDIDRSMQVDKLKLNISMKSKENYLNNPQDSEHNYGALNTQSNIDLNSPNEDKSHISEILHHNPNENTYNQDHDIFHDHEITKKVQINGENPYIYNPHDFEDTLEIALHDDHEKHVHLNEPVFQIQGLIRDSDHSHSPYIVKLPKVYSNPQASIENNHKVYVDSNRSKQLSQQNIWTQPASNLDLLETSRFVKPESQTSNYVLDVSKYFKEDLTEHSPSDMDLNYRSSLPNNCQDRSILPLERIKLLNSGLQNSPFNIGYNGFPTYPQLNQPNFRPNAKLVIDRNSQQFDSRPGIYDQQIVDAESICDTDSISSSDNNQPFYKVGIKESSLPNKHLNEANLMQLESGQLRPQQFTIPESTHGIFSDRLTQGKDNYITSVPCSSDIGIGRPNSEFITPYINPNFEYIKLPIDAVPKDLYLQNVLNNMKQHPYVTNPRFIHPYLQNLLPLPSQEIIPTQTLPCASEFEKINPNLNLGALNLNPILQPPLNSFWNNPRQYICPSNPSNYPLQNLPSYPTQKLPFGPQFKNPYIPSPLLLNNNFDEHDFSGSLLQQDFFEPSLINTGSTVNKPCFANQPQFTPSDRPLPLPETGLPCLNLPINNEHLNTPYEKLTPYSKTTTEFTGQVSQGNSQLLPHYTSDEQDTTHMIDSSQSSTASTKLNIDIQNSNIKDNIPVNPTTSSAEFHASEDYLDSSLIPPSILSPCFNNENKPRPSIQYGSETETGELLSSYHLPSPNINPNMLYPPKSSNYMQAPSQGFLDSSVLPPSILSPCFNPEFKSQPNFHDLPQYNTDTQNIDASENIYKQPSSFNLQPPMEFSPSKKPSFTHTPSQNYLDSSLLPPILSPCNSDIKTQPTIQDILSQYARDSQFAKLSDYISRQIPHLKPMQYSSPQIPNFVQTPCHNYLDSSLLPSIETLPNEKGISQYDSHSLFEMADNINKQPRPDSKKTHVQPTIQNHLDSSLLPQSITPCYNSEIDNLTPLPNMQSIYQFGTNLDQQLLPLSLQQVPYSQNKIPIYNSPQEYLDSSLLPPSILSPNFNLENKPLPSLQDIPEYFTGGQTTGLPENINQPTFLNLKPPSFSPYKLQDYNPNLQPLIQPETTYIRPVVNQKICNTPSDTMTINSNPMLKLQNSETNNGPSPCAQLSSPGICEESSLKEIPSLYNIPSLVSAFPNIFAPNNLQYNTGPSTFNSVSPGANIDSSSGSTLTPNHYSEFDNQLIPLSSPTISLEYNSNTESSSPHSYTLPSNSNTQLPSSLIGPSIKPLLWPKLPQYPVSFLPQNLIPSNYLPQANILNNLESPLSFSSVPGDYSPYIPDSIANLNYVPLSPKLLSLNKPFIPQQVFNPYTFTPTTCQSSMPYVPHNSPTLHSTDSFASSSIPSNYLPSPYDSQIQYSNLPLSNNLPHSPFTTNQFVPTSYHSTPCFTSEINQPIAPENINVEVTSQVKSTAHNSQVNNKEYLSIPQLNTDASSKSQVSLPSHLIKPSLDAILDTELSNTNQAITSSPISDISLSVDSVSETNTYPYTPNINKQQNYVSKLETFSESVPVKSDSINMELSVSNSENLSKTGSGFIHDLANKVMSIDENPCAEEIATNTQNIGKHIDDNNADNDDEIESEHVRLMQSELIGKSISTESYKEKTLQTKQEQETSNQYKLEVNADVSIQQSTQQDNDINILPSTLIPGSSILSNIQEISTINEDLTLVEASHIKSSYDENSQYYSTNKILSSELQAPSLSDLEYSTSSYKEISKQVIPQNYYEPFLDSTLRGNSLTNILSSPSQSNKYTISSIDRNIPYDSRQKSILTKEYLQDSRWHQMQEELQPTYQYIPSSVDNIIPQSEFSGTMYPSQLPYSYQGSSTSSYLPLDHHLLPNIDSQLDYSLLTSLNDFRPLVDTNLPCNTPKYTLISQRPETINTFNPYTVQPEHYYPPNNDLSKIFMRPTNVGGIPQSIATLPYSDSNVISNSLSPYRPIYSYPCGLDSPQTLAPMPLPPNYYNPQGIFTNPQTPPIYHPYSPIFGTEKLPEVSPCQQKLNDIANEMLYTIPTNNDQPDLLPVSPCAIENSPLSTSNIYLPAPFEMSPPESLYSPEYMPPIIPPPKSIPQFQLPSYSVPQLSRPSESYLYPDTMSSPIQKIPINQYPISEGFIKDSSLLLPDLQSLGISYPALKPICVNSPFNANRFISPPISIVPQYNIKPLIPQTSRIPLQKQKFVTLPCSRPQPVTYASPPLTLRPVSPYLPMSIQPISQPLPPSIKPIYTPLSVSSRPIYSAPPVYTTPILPSNQLPIQPSYIQPQTKYRPISEVFSKPPAFTIPQFQSYSSPIPPTYSTVVPSPTPIVSPTVPCGFAPLKKPQFSVISNPITSSYTTVLPASTPILPPSSIPFLPTSTKAQLPVISSPMLSSYTTLLPTTPTLPHCSIPLTPSYNYPQSPVIPCPIASSYTTPLPAVTPIFSPSTISFTPCSTNRQLPVKFSPKSSTYTTPLPAATPILAHYSIPCTPSFTTAQLPCKLSPISPSYTTIVPAPTPILPPPSIPFTPAFTIPLVPCKFSQMSPCYTTILPATTPLLAPSSIPYTTSSPYSQFPVKIRPIPESYTTILPAPPISPPSFIPCISSSSKAQFPVKFSPLSATILPETTPILTPCTPSFVPCSTSPVKPCRSNVIPLTYKILPSPSYSKPTPNYIRPLSESYSYAPPKGSTYQVPPVTTGSLLPCVQAPTNIARPLSTTYATPISPIFKPQSVSPCKYLNPLPSEYINSVFIDNKPIQKNPFIQSQKYGPLPSYLPNQVNVQPKPNVMLKPCQQPLTFTTQAANVIPQRPQQVLYPTNIPRPKFIKYSPQAMNFSPLLYTEKPANLIINEPILSPDNLYQDNYETGKEVNAELPESPMEILENIESVISENTQANTAPIPFNLAPNFNQQLLSPCLTQSAPYSKLPFSTSVFSSPYSYQNIPRPSAIGALPCTSNIPAPWIIPQVPFSPTLTSEALPSYLEYPYNIGPIDIRQKPKQVDSSLPSSIPNYQETDNGQIPSSYTPNLDFQVPQYNQFKLAPESLPAYNLPSNVSPTWISNLPNFVPQAPQSTHKLPPLPTYSYPPSVPLSPTLSSASSSYITPSVIYPEQISRPLERPITPPSTASYNTYSTPISTPVSERPCYSYPSQIQWPVPQYLKPCSIPLQVPKSPLNPFTPALRPCSQFAVPSSITSPLSENYVKNPDLTYYIPPNYLTPQSYLNNIVPPNVYTTKQNGGYPNFAPSQEVPITSEFLPCPLAVQENLQESSSSFEPLVSESLTSQEYLDSIQKPPSSTLSDVPTSFDKSIQFTPITKPCTPRYRQADLPKELKDLLQKMSRPKVSNYQYPCNNYQYAQNLPQPILATPLSNVDVSEIQPVPSSLGNSVPQISPQYISAMDLNNLQNTIANAIHKPILPQYINPPIYGSPISSLYTPTIPSTLSKPSISLPESTNTDFITPDLDYTETSQVNTLPETQPVKPCLSQSNQPLINPFASQGTPPLQYYRQPCPNVPTDLNFAQESAPIEYSRPMQYSRRPTFNQPKWFTLPCLPFLGNNNQINLVKPSPSSLQRPSVLETPIEDSNKVSMASEVEYNLSPLTYTEYTSEPISAPTLNQLPTSPFTPVDNQYQYLPKIPQNKFFGNKPFNPNFSPASNYPIYSPPSVPPAESLTLSEDVSSPPLQPCPQIKPSQPKFEQSPFNIRPIYQQFSPPQFLPAFTSPYLYNLKQNPAENQPPTPTSQNMLPQLSYPYTTPGISLNVSPSQLQSPLLYPQSYRLPGIQKLLRPANLTPPQYTNAVSYDEPLSAFESNYVQTSSDVDVSPSSQITAQTQVNNIHPLLEALNKRLTLQAYSQYMPCGRLKPKENYYLESTPSISRPLPVSAEISSSGNTDYSSVDVEVNILPNTLQNPQLSSSLSPQYSILPSSPVNSYPQQQGFPLNTVSSSYIQSPSTAYLSPSLVSKPPPPLINTYSETLSTPCQNPLSSQTQNWSSIPNMAKYPPMPLQPNWWYQNGLNRIPFIKPNINPCIFNTFIPSENNDLTSSEILTPRYDNIIIGTNDTSEENTIDVNVNKYKETPNDNEIVGGRLNEVEIDNSVVSSDNTKSIDETRTSNEENYTDFDFNPYENLNNLQGPNPESKYTLKEEHILAPFGKSVPEEYISTLNIPNISTEENSSERAEMETVKPPPYIYYRNIDNILRNAPKYQFINAANRKSGSIVSPNNINYNNYHDLSKLRDVDVTPCYMSPNEYETSNNNIQKPATFNLYPNEGNNYGNNLISNKLEEFNNQPTNINYENRPTDLYRNTESIEPKPLEICNDLTQIPTKQYQYYPQLTQNYSKNTYPQMRPFITTNFQIPSLESEKLLDDDKDYPNFAKPCQFNNMKYSGYKTYQMPNLYPPKITQPICNTADYNIPIQNAPFQTNLDFSNWQQSSNLNELPVSTENEIKTNLINYLKQADQNIGADTKELSIPIRKFAIVKPLPCSEHTIPTKKPYLGLKVWKSNIKVVEAEIKFKFKDLSVINFMPIVNNLDDYDIEEIKNVVKGLINEKYGEHFDVNEPYVHNNEYNAIKEIDKDLKYGKYNLLWPTKCVNA